MLECSRPDPLSGTAESEMLCTRSLAKQVNISGQLSHMTGSMLCENPAPTLAVASQQEMFVITGSTRGLKEKLLSHMTSSSWVM